jgi:hypothetical protein
LTEGREFGGSVVGVGGGPCGARVREAGDGEKDCERDGSL